MSCGLLRRPLKGQVVPRKIGAFFLILGAWPSGPGFESQVLHQVVLQETGTCLDPVPPAGNTVGRAAHPNLCWGSPSVTELTV